MAILLVILAKPARTGGQVEQSETPIRFTQSVPILDIVREERSFVIGESKAQEAERKLQEARALLELQHPSLPPQSQGQVGDDTERVRLLIVQKSTEYGVDAERALRIAKCESNFNPNAINKSSGASGVFQYLPSTWANTPEGKEGKSPFDAEANIRAAIRHMAVHGYNAWVCK